MSMINLMPPEQKKEIRYARRNEHLIKWVIGVLIALAIILSLVLGSIVFLRQNASSNTNHATKVNQDLKAQKQEETIARVNELSGNLKLTVDVLENEILFSKLLEQIGNVMPNNTILTSLTLTNELSGGLDLVVNSVDYESGVQAQLNLADPEKGLFQKADIGSVQCNFAEPSDYPCSTSIRVLFAEDNQEFTKLYKEEE